MAEKYHVIGLMSGTSLDGLDIAFVEFIKSTDRWQYNIIKTLAIEYDATMRSRLAKSIELDESELRQLDQQYGSWLGEQVNTFTNDLNDDVQMIASHGHTVFHQPDKGITRQIGDGQTIAKATGFKTISDFRSLDVQRGGQGAPLVPIGDMLLFPEYLACLNLGGIANISFAQDGQRLAFDIGMANMPLNYFARQLGYQFDKDGALAVGGVVKADLAKALDNLAYYTLPKPKSLGLEWFLSEMLPLLNSFKVSIEDKLATLVHHEARQIGKVIKALNRPGKILVTGGGAYNKYFIKLLRENLLENQLLELPSQQLIDFKEALIFALMGVLRERNEINCLKSVTGARQDSCAGRVFMPEIS